MEAIEQRETLKFGDFVDNPDVFALQVRGDSMIDDHIQDGDFVVVHGRQTADNGEMVIALVHGAEATVKRFYRESGGWIRLQPANAAVQPLRVRESDVLIHVHADGARFRDPVSTAMMTNLQKLDVRSPIESLLPVFERGHVAIVVDGEDFLGLITRIDLLNWLRRKVD